MMMFVPPKHGVSSEAAMASSIAKRTMQVRDTAGGTNRYIQFCIHTYVFVYTGLWYRMYSPRGTLYI